MMFLRPALVDHAKSFAESIGFTQSCLDEVGELLHVLVGHLRDGKIAEIGTGCGVSTAWIASATSLDVYTVDSDCERASAIRHLSEGTANVHLIFDEWERILRHGPFRFIFVDAGPAKLGGIEKIIEATELGGLIVLDDLTPVEFCPMSGEASRIRFVTCGCTMIGWRALSFVRV